MKVIFHKISLHNLEPLKQTGCATNICHEFLVQFVGILYDLIVVNVLGIALIKCMLHVYYRVD